jgi:carboxypeptidase Taq
LEKAIEYGRQTAEYIGGYEHIADPLIGLREFGITTAMVRRLFAQLRGELVQLMSVIRQQGQINASCLFQHFPKKQQYDFARRVITAFGFDWERGRMDETLHPFATSFGIGDVRITTRANDQHLGDGLFATFHEAGHALYMQGMRREPENIVHRFAPSAGVHESQSRLWENRIGRSKGFWKHYYPELQQEFPTQLGAVPLDVFYGAINKVQGSLIRVQADEVTYNLHIMIRSDLEIDLLEGKLSVKNLPEAWNARYTSDVGITPSNHSDGVLQDSHWFRGRVGGTFEGYTLGNILSAQYYESAVKSYPEIETEIELGQFTTLSKWLRENIWQHGRTYTPLQLTERITGDQIRVEPLTNYLKSKFGEIYGVVIS